MAPSLCGQGSLAGRGGVGGQQPLRGGGGRQGGLQVDRLMEKLVADQHNQGEETQLEVAEMVESTNAISDLCIEIHCLFFFKEKYLSLIHTHYSFVGVLASLALMMKRGKRMENKQPLGRKE